MLSIDTNLLLCYVMELERNASPEHLDLVRPVLEMLVTLPGGGAASLATSAACPLLIE
jgi:hypothetical protein